MSKFTYLGNRTSFAHQGQRSFTRVNTNLALFLTRFLPISLFIFLWFGVAFGQNPSPIGKPGKAGDFEIDGDFIANNYTSPGKDWRSVFTVDANNSPFVTKTAVAGENAKWVVDGNSGSGSTIPETEVFRGSSNKNGDFIGANQSPYLIETQSPSAPQKNDITNVYARSTVLSGNQWIHLGAETRSVDGTSYLDFEYNKAGVHTTATNLIGDGPITEGGRTARKVVNGVTIAGDVLFVVDFAKGGNAPVPKIFEWRATGKTKPAYDWFELNLADYPNSVYIVTNGSNINSLGFNSGFAGDGTSSSTVLALQLVEIGVDLTALGLADNVCNPNATLTCKTRTSSSYTSELKDFSLFKFSAVPSATLSDPTDQSVCPNSDATFSTTASGPGASVSNISWYKVVGSTETPITDDDVNYDITTSNLTSTLKIIGVATSDAGTYRAKLSGATCGTPSQDADLTIKITAALTDLSPQTKCPGLDATFSTDVSGTGASAANVEWYFGTTKIIEDGTKYIIEESGSTSTLTIKSVDANDAGTYKAKLVSADCGAPEKSNTLTVNETATLTNLSPQTKCVGEDAEFSTSVAGTGATAANVQWYKVVGATETLISSAGRFTITVSGNTSTLAISDVEEADEATYKAKLANATCGTPEKSSTLTVNPLPIADAGTDPAEQCYIAAGNEFTVGGDNTASGTAQWTVFSPDPLPEGVTVEFDNDKIFKPKVTVKGAPDGITITLRLTVTSDAEPSCGSDDDDVVIKVKAQAQSKDGTILPITCIDVSFKLKIVPDANTTYRVTQPCNSAYDNSNPVVDNDGNFIFGGLKFGAGYKIVASKDGCEAAPFTCGGTTCTDICPPQSEITQSSTNKVVTQEGNTSNIKSGRVETVSAKIGPAQTKVLAAPNPYQSKVRFSLESAVSGQGSLEIYNTLGQKIATVYQGYIQQGVNRTVEYSVPDAHRASLIYVFKVGDQRVTGKLINLRD